jgi:hypothetical protein
MAIAAERSRQRVEKDLLRAVPPRSHSTGVDVDRSPVENPTGSDHYDARRVTRNIAMRRTMLASAAPLVALDDQGLSALEE